MMDKWAALIGPVFTKKDKKSLYFDSFGGVPDIFLLNKITKPKTYHKYKTQNVNSRLGCTYCLYFFCRIE